MIFVNQIVSILCTELALW